MEMTQKRLVSESLVSELRRVDEGKDKKSSALCIVEGPCMEFGRVNQNNRVYSRKLVEDRIINYKPVQDMIKNKCMLGEGGHPETRIDISYPEVGLCVEKIWIPEDSTHMVYGRFAVLDTPVGRILKTLIDFGSKIGISARALAVSQMDGDIEVMSEVDYDLITFDAVPDPGFKSAHLERVKENLNEQSIESMSTSDLKNNVAALSALKIPAFEGRMRELTKELTKRTDDEAINAVFQSHLNGKNRNQLATGRREESKRSSVHEILETKTEIEQAQAKEMLPRLESELAYYKSRHEEIKEELRLLTSEKDVLSKQNESLKHGIAKGLYQARYLEKFSYLTCQADSLSRRLDASIKRLNKLSTVLGNNRQDNVKTYRAHRHYKGTKYEQRQHLLSIDDVLNSSKEKDFTKLKQSSHKQSVASLISATSYTNQNKQTKQVNIKEALERYKQKVKSVGIKEERLKYLLENSEVITSTKVLKNSLSLERKIKSISNFERDTHDLAPKRGLLLTYTKRK